MLILDNDTVRPSGKCPCESGRDTETVGDMETGEERRDTCDEDEAVTSQAGLNQRYKRGNLRENFVTSCDQVGGEDELLHNTWETQTDGHPAMYLDNILIHFHGIVDNFHTFGHQLMLQVNA